MALRPQRGTRPRQANAKFVGLLHTIQRTDRTGRQELGESLSAAHDLGGERLQRVPVVRPLSECDVEARAAERAELVHDGARFFHRSPQVAGPRGAVGVAAPVALEDLLAAGGAPRTAAEYEAEVHAAHDRPGVAPFLVAPLIEDLALVLPVVRADVGAVPAVGVFRGGTERPLLPSPADPDRYAGLKRLGIVWRVRHLEILPLEVRAPLLGRQEQPQDLRVLLEHVLAWTDRREREAVGLGLDVVPAGTEAASDSAVRQT